MICVSIGRTRHRMVLAEIEEATRRGAQLIELRLDFITRAIDFKRLLAVKGCPFIATLRRQADGGRFAGTEEQRQMLLRQIIASKEFEWVDLETDIADKIQRFGPTQRIVSYHNLREMPKDLERIHANMCAQDADVVKIAVRAEHPLDNLRALQLCWQAERPTIAICMGEMGLPSRILAAKFGAPFTYAAFNKERGIAPGILSVEEMQYVYHYDQINPATRVYAVLGDPIAQSLSPLVHNRAFRQFGINAVYVPMRVPKTDFEATVDVMRKLPVHGYSITIPHKETAAQFAGSKDEMVELTQSANTLIPESGHFRAYNTDTTAAIEALKLGMSDSEAMASLAGRTVLLLGAGGVARSIGFALRQEGAVVLVTNRNPPRALGLAEELRCRAVDWTARNAVSAEIFINCTPVGMHPNVDESPLHQSVFKPGLAVMDCIYNPETTLLVRQARDRGCRVITGVEMFVRQAARQFQLFTGIQPPLDEMRQIVRKAVSPTGLKPAQEQTAAAD
ncbi:MAG TPA: shikimate dehydrogenase [Gemmatales bacterium]|nr:shikimate dehydrogenase [Gemmatales bacterium]HMP57906.1 shikimate dehydrogenase [Gemmatales bacterium]